MIRQGPFLALVLALLAPSARAEDPRANAALRLFIDACIPNMGKPEGVRAWAAGHHLQEVLSPAALGVFVGAGENGAAWAVPSPLGSFALSIRAATRGCAVWARAAEPDEVTAGFKKLMQGVSRPDLDVGVDSDTTIETPVGHAHSLVYHVWPSGKYGYAFTLLTAEHSGGAFQVSIQVAGESRQ